MKKLLFPLFMLAMIVTSCEKDPDMNKLDSDYSVYTDYDNSVHFNEFSTYYLPDSILVPDNSLKANYWKDENAQNIISAVAHEMEQKGYVRTEDKEKANVGIQLSYAQQRIQMTTGGWYGGWWDAGFWGPYWGGGWYYPYPVTYSYDTGTLIMEMVDLRQPADKSNQNKLPVIWHAYASGLLYGNSHFNMQLTLNAVNQVFAQSPYLSNKQ